MRTSLAGTATAPNGTAWCSGELEEVAAKLAKGSYVEIEGELRHGSYQKELKAGDKAVAVGMPLTAELNVELTQKLDKGQFYTDAPDQGATEP